MHKLLISSPAFAEGMEIPAKYTCFGDNISPPLLIGSVPPDAVSLALVMHDPDAPGGDWAHWLVWNISPETTEIPEGTPPPGSTEGTSDFKAVGYGGPCPPSGSHRYFFEVYALNQQLSLLPIIKKADLLEVIKDKLVGHGQLMGTCTSPQA